MPLETYELGRELESPMAEHARVAIGLNRNEPSSSLVEVCILQRPPIMFGRYECLSVRFGVGNGESVPII